MNLLFLYDLIGCLKVLVSFITDAYNNLFKDIQNGDAISTYIMDTNRIVIFILGITVSANIYLYNARTKISFSSIWTSNQIRSLYGNLITNLIILLLGAFILQADFVLNLQFSSGQLKALLVIHFFIRILSLILFIMTLHNFLSSFRLSKNMKRSFDEIKSMLYPRRWMSLYKRRKLVLRFSEQRLNRHINKWKLDSSIIKGTLNVLNKASIFRIVVKFLSFIIKFLYLIYDILNIIFIVRHPLIDETSFYTKKEIRKLRLSIEIYCENLEYIISSNSEKGMDEYCKKWNELFGKIVQMLFHIHENYSDKNSISILYKSLLHNHSKLILITSESYEHRDFHREFIKSMFNALAYKEEFIDSSLYQDRTKSLEDVYYNELFTLLVDLMQKNDSKIFDLLLSEELNLLLFITSKDDSKTFYGNRNRKEKYEELFVSILFKMIELKITAKITTVMAIIFSLSMDERDTNTGSPILLSSSKKGFGKVSKSSQEREVNLSHKNKCALFYATIKANELESYKEAGYLIKVLSSNIKFSSLMNAVLDVRENTKTMDNISFKNGITKIDFNNFSFDYCMNKTIVLFFAQYVFKNAIESKREFWEVFNGVNYSYLFTKVVNSSNDYGMTSLRKRTFNELEIMIKDNQRLLAKNSR